MPLRSFTWTGDERCETVLQEIEQSGRLQDRQPGGRRVWIASATSIEPAAYRRYGRKNRTIDPVAICCLRALHEELDGGKGHGLLPSFRSPSCPACGSGDRR